MVSQEQILLGLIVSWAASAALTAAGVFSADRQAVDYMARADAKLEVIQRTPWLQLTYPGK